MGDITWTNEKRKLSELIPWGRNPRQITRDQAKRLEQSLDEFGQIETIAVDPQNMILDGHQRELVWSASGKFGKDYEVDVRVSSRELTEKEREKLVIYLHKGAAGEWDFEKLANGFEVEELIEWGFDQKELGIDDTPLPAFKEYDESVEDEVEYITCPECGNKWPK